MEDGVPGCVIVIGRIDSDTLKRMVADEEIETVRYENVLAGDITKIFGR